MPHLFKTLFSRSHTEKMEWASDNLSYYLAAAGLFILLKFSFTLADTGDLAFLLNPTDKLIGFLTGSHSVYMEGTGYYHDRLDILIDKSCSGFNFWILCFLMLSFLVFKFFNKHLHKLLVIPVTLVVAYLLTIFVNTSRIFASIIIQNQAGHFLPGGLHSTLHEATGIITNLAFLILIYYLTERFIILRQKHEKFTQP